MTHRTSAVTNPSPAQNIPAGSLRAGVETGRGDTDPCGHEHDVLQAIRNTTFGTIEVTVHQSRIVQITRSEKLRF
jgi:hypothetical protein